MLGRNLVRYSVSDQIQAMYRTGNQDLYVDHIWPVVLHRLAQHSETARILPRPWLMTPATVDNYEQLLMPGAVAFSYQAPRDPDFTPMVVEPKHAVAHWDPRPWLVDMVVAGCEAAVDAQFCRTWADELDRHLWRLGIVDIHGEPRSHFTERLKKSLRNDPGD